MGDQSTFVPFKNIGLCFSGGGYRATFFALGVVSYLNELEYEGKTLLEHVAAISSVSGGTLLSVAYANAAQEEDFDFKSFFKTFYNTFTPENDKLLPTAVAKLEDDAVWEAHPHKKRSLINAFALTYAEMPVFEGNFSSFKNPASSHLKQVCFNATDFSFGLTYRFQNTGYFGNDPLHNKQVNKLKYNVVLGDIIASSSCFPLGFEPLVFPDDYFKDQNNPDYIALKSLDRFKDGVGIMDGGIADNQGIGSMMLINERMDNGLDLIMVNDVGSFKMEPWEQDTTKLQKSPTLRHKLSKLLSYFSVKPLYWSPLLFGVLMVVLNSLHIFSSTAWTSLYIVGSILIGVGLVLTLIGIVASIVKSFAVRKFNKLLSKNVPEALLADVISFKNLDISLLQRMITDRLTSASKMINDVFLKQMRRLNYDLFYSKSSLKHRRVTATVYKLNGMKTAYSGDAPSYNKEIKPKPSTLLTSVGLTASETPTTLWWDQKDIALNRMDTLIACGQFTVCYELMDYILKLKSSDLDLDFTEVDKLYSRLKSDWKTFNKNPFYLVNELK